MKLPSVVHKRRRRLIARLIANGFGQATAAVLLAFLVRLVFERLTVISTGPAPDGFGWIVALLAGAIGVSVLLRVIERQDAARLGEDYVTQVRLRLFDALTAAPVLTTKRRGLGPMMLRFVTDLTAVRQWISNGMARLLVSSLATMGTLIALIAIDPPIGFAIAGIAATTILIGAALGRNLTVRIRKVRSQRSQLASRIGDRLSALGVVQLTGQVRRERRAISRYSRKLADAAVARAQLSSIVRVLPDAALGFSMLAILIVGGSRLAAGEVNHGTIIAALAVLGALSPHVRALGRIFEYWKNYQVATEKLRNVLAGVTRPRTRSRGKSQGPVQGRIAFENISVSGALSDVSATAEPGSIVAIVGRSGAGKSSLLAVAARLMHPNSGRVLLDGEDISHFDGETYARHVGMVSRDFPLLKGSIRWNLAYRVKGATDEAIAEACRLCGVEEEIERLPDGLMTRVTEESFDLPHGLRQRLNLARAVFGTPAILLLDDPDSGLDPLGRAVFDRILSARRFTILLATHDLARVRAADAVWYFENGRLLEVGSPAAVLSGNGPTARFFNLGNHAAGQSSVVSLIARQRR